MVDESYLNNHKSAKVRTSTLVRYVDEHFSSEQVSRSRGAPKAKVAPSSSSSRVLRENLETENPYVNSSAASASRPAGEFSFEGVTFTVFEAAGVSGGSSSSSGAVAVPEPKAAPLRRELQLTYRPCSPSQHCYRPFTDRVERIEQVDLVGIRAKSIVKVLCLDWHQVVDRGRDDKTDTLGKVPTSNLRTISNIIGKANQNYVQLFVGILSYIDTDRTQDKTINYIRATTGFSSLVSFIVICRRDAVGWEGKSAIICDFCAQCTLSEEQILLVDDKVEVLEEVQNYSPAVSVIHVKLPRKPSFGGRAPAVSFFAESEQLIEDWLLR